jgi:hypothetical protein
MPLDQWLVLALTCCAAIVGLLVAASGGTGTGYGLGLVLFAAAVVYAFYLVKRHFDRADQLHH